MISLFAVLALFLADQPPAEGAAIQGPPTAQSRPASAPKDDYQYVAWCYGALRGYVDLHDQVMPEVTRIETEFRAPGRKLSDDLKVYADQQRQAKGDLKQFQAALTAAEKASLKPINAVGAEAVRKGRSIWNPGPEVSKARLAQEWMSWTPPASCGATAAALEERARLAGPAFQVNAEPDAPPAPAETPAPGV
jgi:hypothetical protein